MKPHAHDKLKSARWSRSVLGERAARAATSVIWLWAPLILLLSAVHSPAQPAAGPLYYAVEDLESQRVVLRGTSDGEGDELSRLNLAPNRRHRLWILEAATLRIGSATFTSANAGQSTTIPTFVLTDRVTHDADSDGLSDLGEFIVGTDGLNPDTDGDGLLDGAEVLAGLDPNSGRAVRTGVIAAAGTPGTALHVTAFNDLAVVADSDRGISVFNIFNTMNPVIIAQVDTPGTATATAFAGNLIAVADGERGLAIVEISDPPAARIVHRIGLGNGLTRAVAVAGPIAYVGNSHDPMAVVDLPSGRVLERPAVIGVDDMVVDGDQLYVLTTVRLNIYRLFSSPLELLGSVTFVGNPAPGKSGRSLFVGGGLAYVGYVSGYATIDVRDPTAPQVIAMPSATQFSSTRDLGANGSGLLVVLAPTTRTGPFEVTLYDGSDPMIVTNFITSVHTPSEARQGAYNGLAVSLYNGLAYVAEVPAGLQVVNYLPFDALRQPPTITISAGATSVEEGKLLRVSAVVTDDVQPRNVEFYVDGARVATDGNFPFEHWVTAPLRAPGKTSFTVRARASDTGGNATFSEELVIDLLPDVTPPQVARAVPANGGLVGAANSVEVYFNEPLAPTTVSSAGVRLIAAGPDGVINTADDALVTGGVISYRGSLNAVFLNFGAELAPGVYRGLVSPSIADAAGNRMQAEFGWAFRVLGFPDADQDGVADSVEASLGLDPTNPDSDGDGILDGLEDRDNDGLNNAGEALLGTNPLVADSDGNGVRDSDEDRDNDTVRDGVEVVRGTNPFARDSDGDGWPDEAELLAGSDPLNPNSVPLLFVPGAAQPTVVSLGIVSGDGSGSAAFKGQPPVEVRFQ
jgi:hypothetical protein